MARNLDKKMLTGFVQEVRGYLPQIRVNLDRFAKDPQQREALEETYRFMHTIKGASAMVGLAVLSHVTYYVEGLLEELRGGQVRFDQAMGAWILRATDHLEGYLDHLLSGTVPEQAIVTDVVQSFRRLRALPESGDAAAIEEVLSGQDEPVRSTPAVALSGQGDSRETTDFLRETPVSETTTAGDFGLDATVPDTLDINALAETLPDTAGKPTPSAPVHDRQSSEQTPRDTMSLVDTGGELEALIASIDQQVSQVHSSPTPARTPAAPKEPVAAVRKEMADRYVLFDLAGAQYAVSVTSVFEVGRVPTITPVPNVPSWVRGVINLRGEILSIIDFRTFLGIADGTPRDSSRMMVIKSAGDEVTTSLIVDRVVGITQLPQARFAPPPAPDTDRVAPYLTGVCQHQDHVLAIFNLEHFLLSPEVCQFS